MASPDPRPGSFAPSDDGLGLGTPRPAFAGDGPAPGQSVSGLNTPRDSLGPGAIPDAASATSDPAEPIAPAPFENEKALSSRRPFLRRPIVWLGALAALAVVVIVIVVPVVVTHKNSSNRTSSGSSSGSSSGDGGGSSSGGGSSGGGSSGGNTGNPGATSGGNGSVITLADGSKVTYINNFGGIWVDDPKNPFSYDAYPNSWTPALNTSWTWGKDRVYGVNLGGWLVLEPFISPALFQAYPNTIDEWSLSQAIAADPNSGGLQAVLEKHYSTFITEKDFMEIAAAGLNWIRLPVAFWAIETWPGEPLLPQVSWKYAVQAFEWARKYGLRVFLDLHAVPGSQNGYNHGGKEGQINFLNGLMGLANAQRTLTYIRILTEFISQPQYVNVVPMFGIVNEVLIGTVGTDELASFYVEAMADIRANITGYGAGNGPFIAIHDGFQSLSSWANYLPGTDRLVLDTHPYFAFGSSGNTDPLTAAEQGQLTDKNAYGGVWPQQACTAWQSNIDQSQSAFGVTVSGEFSNAINDCGLWINGVGNGPTYSGDCTPYNDWQNYSPAMKSGLQEFALASMDAMQNWFFWTWKIGNSSNGTVGAPLWSYQLGLENGWMPTDPRTSVGKCAALVKGQSTTTLSTYSYAASQTGSPAPSAPPAANAEQYPWPPKTLSAIGGLQYPALIPQYTPTGSVITLAMPTVTKGVSEGSGWDNTADTEGAYTQISGCSYPNAWDSSLQVTPTAACGAGGAAAAPTATTTRGGGGAGGAAGATATARRRWDARR